MSASPATTSHQHLHQHQGPSMDQFTTVFRASEPRKIRRARQTLSCAACQKRKLRCDRVHPCGACQKRGDEGGCFFPSTSGTANGKTTARDRPRRNAGRHHEVHSRLDKLEELVKSLAAEPQAAPPAAPQGDEPAAPAAPAAPPSRKFTGPTKWSALVSQLQDIQSALADGLSDDDDDGTDAGHEGSGSGGTPDANLATEPDIVIGQAAPVDISEIMAALPPRAEVDRLVVTYFGSQYLAVPFIHTHQFQRRYEAFWRAPGETSLLWISLLFGVISCGSVVAANRESAGPGWGQAGPDVGLGSDALRYSRMQARCLVSGRYLDGRPGSVEAALMLVHVCGTQRKDGDAAVWTLLSVVIRIAQRQGYHRDPERAGLAVTPFEAEMRRRAWFQMQSYDLLFSYQHGMPAMVAEGTHDTLPPTAALDDDFDEDSVSAPVARPDTYPFPVLFLASKARVLPIFRRMLVNASGVDPPKPREADILDAQLDAWRRDQVPDCLRYRPVRQTPFSDANETIMHRIILETVYHMSKCLNYRPFVNVPSSSPSHQDAAAALRTSHCRDSALALLDMHFELHRETQPGGRLHRDRYMVSSLSLHSFLVAAMVICVELKGLRSQPVRDDERAMPPAQRRHLVGMLETAHAVWHSRVAFSHDARHACRVLRAILNTVDANKAKANPKPSKPSKPSNTTTPSTTGSTTSDPSNSNPSSSSSVSVPDANPVTLDVPGLDAYPLDYDLDVSALNFDEMPSMDSLFADDTLDWVRVPLTLLFCSPADRVCPEPHRSLPPAQLRRRSRL